MSDRFLYIYAAWFGFISGASLIADGLIDLFEFEQAVASLPATTSTPLGILAVTGIYFFVRQHKPSTHLDIGYVLNVVGLMTVNASAFARNFVLAPLDDDLAESIAMGKPTSIALILGGVFAVLGIVTFGSALIRSEYDRVGAWLYTLALPLTGFAVLLPAEVGAVIATAAGIAVIRVSQVMYLNTASQTPASAS